MHIQNLSSLCGIAKKIASSRTIPHPVGGICKMIKTVAVEYACDGFVFFRRCLCRGFVLAVVGGGADSCPKGIY